MFREIHSSAPPVSARIPLLPPVATALTALLAACAAPETRVLRWGGDAEGGAPFVEADPADPLVVRGFDVEIAGMIAEGLGREPRFVQTAWTSLEPSLARGDFDVALSGMEDHPELRVRNAVSLPYFQFREVIAVRPEDRARFRTLAELRGRRVGTLAATTAHEILQREAAGGGAVPVAYEDDVHPYTDLVAGRVDAVLLDHVIAERALRRTGGFVIQPEVVATGHYVAVFPAGRTALRDSADAILRARMADGSLERTFRRWEVWDDAQAAHFQQILSRREATGGGPARARTLAAYLPALLRAAGITLVLSCLSMGLAIVLGMGIAVGRLYGPGVLRAALTAYVEVIRGTPLLLQLFVLYYGLSGVVRLPAFLAAVAGLGLNYAAYESEIYRSALRAVPRAQLEAGRTLGLSELQVLRLIRAPQAVRLALAPSTNDFVALLKDSSLVSVITVVELTKQTAIYATNLGSWVVPGLVCAALYLLMSLPLSRAAVWLERRWSPA